MTQQNDENLQPVDVSTARMKCVGGQWLLRLYEYLQLNPSTINNGFQASGIPQSIDVGKPVLDERSDLRYEDESDEDDYEEYFDEVPFFDEDN